jgi:hypothetical protein
VVISLGREGEDREREWKRKGEGVVGRENNGLSTKKEDK